MHLNLLDARLFHALNHSLHIPPLDPVMVFITDQNRYVFLAMFLLFWKLEGRKALIAAVLSIAALGIADLTGHMLKELFTRPRPCITLDEIVLLVKCTKGFSFPSNHSANSFAVALPFVLMGKHRFRYTILALAALVAYSRIYVGVHYPSDVLVGSLIGAGYGWAAVSIYTIWRKKRTPKTKSSSSTETGSEAEPTVHDGPGAP